MPDADLQALLVHTVNVYHLTQTQVSDFDLTEDYPSSPDVQGLACAIEQGGRALMESQVGAIIESEALMFCENADIRERDKIVWTDTGRTFFVNGTPISLMELLGATPAVPHHLEIGLVEAKTQPGNVGE